MAEDRLVVTEPDVKEPNLLLRFLRKVVTKLGDLSTRVSSIETSSAFPSFARISRELQSNGSAPLNLTNLVGQVFQPQLALAPRLSAAPAPLVLQQYQDQQLVLIGSGSAFDLYTVIGGNPTSLVKITPTGAPHNFLSTTHPDTVAATPVLGDIVYSNNTPKWTKLAGNITAAKQFLTQTGTGAVSAAPGWAGILATDIPGTINEDRINSIGTLVPTVTVTGFGATPTVAVLVGSSDLCGRVQITPGGAGIAATGTIVVTFSSNYGTTASMGLGMLCNSGTGTWNARATVFGTGGGFVLASASFTWDNNAVALTGGSIYAFNWILMGR